LGVTTRIAPPSRNRSSSRFAGKRGRGRRKSGALSSRRPAPGVSRRRRRSTTVPLVVRVPPAPGGASALGCGVSAWPRLRRAQVCVGTSFAAPAVSAALAAVRAYRPDWSRSTAESALLAAARARVARRTPVWTSRTCSGRRIWGTSCAHPSTSRPPQIERTIGDWGTRLPVSPDLVGGSLARCDLDRDGDSVSDASHTRSGAETRPFECVVSASNSAGTTRVASVSVSVGAAIARHATSEHDPASQPVRGPPAAIPSSGTEERWSSSSAGPGRVTSSRREWADASSEVAGRHSAERTSARRPGPNTDRLTGRWSPSPPLLVPGPQEQLIAKAADQH
jgi:hypothetical protein